MKNKKNKGGAHKKEDHKVLVGAYIYESRVKQLGGIERARVLATEMLNDNAELEGRGHIAP